MMSLKRLLPTISFIDIHTYMQDKILNAFLKATLVLCQDISSVLVFFWDSWILSIVMEDHDGSCFLN